MMPPNNTTLAAGNKATAPARKPQEPPVRCPRCDSPNTKFCYYNNYSLAQPRHFCKTCRRYWTKGGALRNVPVGGGCRKNKRTKVSPGNSDKDATGGPSDVGSLKFFQGFSPAMDFQLGAINNTPRFDDIFNHFAPLVNLSAAASSTFNLESSSTGFTFPLPSYSFSSSRNGPLGFPEMGSVNLHSNLASSIESLSSMNQDMHWKLQQQRLASLMVGDNNNNHKENSMDPFVPKPHPILFQNLEKSKTGNSNLSTELFFNSSYAPTPTVAPPTPAASGGNNWSGVNEAWPDQLTHFASLP